MAADAYEAIANVSVDPVPNPPGSPLTNWRRYYFQTTHMKSEVSSIIIHTGRKYISKIATIPIASNT
ncbi:hypothetical protein [Halorhabdus amylolytica]|uniref:hypothetical protein n=1 Tax=Halorhabdus amylolytica TaxID=2559573 RepID=UPI00145A8011|nr:hypothetical protein [Halorhabdus amylolytica]